ncbi:MAG TPA: thermonuclease family protein [Candidatus Paceibacterota bacterium]
MKKYKLKIILILIIILVSTLGTYFSRPNYKKKIPKIDPKEEYKVYKILDGDTFQIKVKKDIVTVRMLGVDTPETVDPRKTVQCFGKEASDKTKEILNGKSVKLELDSTQSKTDKFQRILAYVYVDDLLVNKYLIEIGYAHEYTYDIPYRKQAEFKEKEREARKGKFGLWGNACGEVAK